MSEHDEQARWEEEKYHFEQDQRRMSFPRTDAAYLKASEDGPDRIDSLLAECERMEARLKKMESVVVHVYNTGYHAGHNDTVEACYVDIFTADIDTYHAEEVAELVNELTRDNPA